MIKKLFSITALCGSAANFASAEAAATGLPASIERSKSVYMQSCFTCHQITGMSLPGAFPPRVGTEYVDGDPRRMVAMILKGVNPPLKVREITYVAKMLPLPTVYPILNDDKNVSDVVDYVRNSRGNNDEKGVSPEFVKKVRNESSSRATPWTAAELLSSPVVAK